MNADSRTLQGQYFDGHHPVGQPATLILAEREAVVIGPHIARRYAVRKLQVSPRVGGADRFVALPEGGQLQCPDHPLLNYLPQERRSDDLIAWLEQRWGVAIGCVALIAALLPAGYSYGLPVAAERIAARVPIESELEFGQQALVWLDNNHWFKPTRLAPEIRNTLHQGFAELGRGLPMERHYRLKFRDSTFIGPNAFALPGGTIVITDAMVNAAESPEEVLAVLAHEIGHVELRHTMRHVLQDSMTAVAVATVTADAASLSAAVAGLPALLAQARYSREFETEADEFAFRLLKRHGLSPQAFANLMERLAKDHEDKEGGLAFMSSHPVTADRVKSARAAAGP